MNKAIIPVILAGGSGTRLWPLSRKNFPKQFLNLMGNHSLLQETVLRTQKAIHTSHLIIVTSEAHHYLCQEQLKNIGFDGLISYILEPCGRNTAPAIALAASYIYEHIDKNALMLVLPADHLIADVKELSKSFTIATEPAKSGNLVIFGVDPTSPKTGYGYIQTSKHVNSNTYQVKRFVEKPNLDTAKKYVASNEYYWNSGMFLFQPQTYLHELKDVSPNIYKHSLDTYTSSTLKKNTLSIDKEAFLQCPDDSIDYAVMEKTSKAVMVPLYSSWSDLGCWVSIAEAQSSKKNNNILHGNVMEKYSKNCFIRSDSRLVSTIGLNNHIIVSTADAVLVADKKYAEEIKEIAKELHATNNTVTLHHQKFFHSWGYEEHIDLHSFSELKRIVIKPNKAISLSPHNYSVKHWLVINGKGELVHEKKILPLIPQQSITIDKATEYEVKNTGNISLYIIEIIITSLALQPLSD